MTHSMKTAKEVFMVQKSNSMSPSSPILSNLMPPITALNGRPGKHHSLEGRDDAATPTRIAGLYGHNPRQNHILAALPREQYERLAAQLEFASMPFGMTVCEAAANFQYVYFPTSSVVSILHDTKDGGSVETAVIGNEGVIGISHCMSGGAMPSRTVVKSAGCGFRLRAALLKEEFDHGGALQSHLLRFIQALLTQMSQTAVCNRHHSVAQQLCRWLLFTLDRLPSNELSMTQEWIANMLGVRRESVAEAASKLQEENVIHYSRGHIMVLDRAGLELRACECYACVKREYSRLLPAQTDPATVSGGAA